MQVSRASVPGSTAQCAAQTAKRTATSVSRAVLRLKAGQMASAQVSLYHARSVAVFKRTNVLRRLLPGYSYASTIFLTEMIQCPFSQTDDYGQALTDKMVSEHSGVDM